jgi:hypothetical protein
VISIKERAAPKKDYVTKPGLFDAVRYRPVLSIMVTLFHFLELCKEISNGKLL